MIPLADVDTPPKRSPAFVTYGLILLNVAVFIYELTLNPGSKASDCFTFAYSFDPAVLAHLLTAPGGYAQEMCQTTQFHLIAPWLTIFTAMFLHAGILHIGGNMLFLYIFGDNVEDALGHLAYLIFYLFCGVIAALTQTFFTLVFFPGQADIPNLGASGAIAGVLAAYFVLFPAARIRTLILLAIFGFFTTIYAWIVILFWFALQLLNGVAAISTPGQNAGGGVAYFAHIGGFVAGLIVMLTLKYFGRSRPTSSGYA